MQREAVRRRGKKGPWLLGIKKSVRGIRTIRGLTIYASNLLQLEEIGRLHSLQGSTMHKELIILKLGPSQRHFRNDFRLGIRGLDATLIKKKNSIVTQVVFS